MPKELEFSIKITFCLFVALSRCLTTVIVLHKEYKSSFHLRKQTVPQLYFPLVSTEGGNVLHSAVGSRVASYRHPPNLTHIHTWLHSRGMSGSESIPREEWITLCLGLFFTRSTVKVSYSLYFLTIWKQGLEPRSRDNERSAMNLWIHSLTTHDLFTTNVWLWCKCFMGTSCIWRVYEFIYSINKFYCVPTQLYLERNKIGEVPDLTECTLYEIFL